MKGFLRRSVLTSCGVLLAAAACVHRAQSSRAADLNRDLDEIMRSLVDGGRTVGAACGVQHWGERAFLSCYGAADLSAGKSVDDETVFRIASITKTFVASAVMQLVERGDLALDRTLSTFFPDFPRGEEVTIYQLLSHTSGLKEWWEGGLPEGTPPNFIMEPAPHRYLQAMREHYNFNPGTQHWYSNCGYILLGEIVEIVSGRSLADYLRQEVIARADLSATVAENYGMSDARWAKGYAHAPDRTPPFAETVFENLPGAAGCLRSTAADLIAWSDALFSGRVVSGATIDQMSRMATVSDGRPVSEATWTPPGMTEPPKRPDFIQEPGWGLGLSLFTSSGQPVVWHSGGIPGFNSIWLNFPKQRLTIVLLANTDNGVVPAFEQIMPRIAGAN